MLKCSKFELAVLHQTPWLNFGGSAFKSRNWKGNWDGKGGREGPPNNFLFTQFQFSRNMPVVKHGHAWTPSVWRLLNLTDVVCVISTGCIIPPLYSGARVSCHLLLHQCTILCVMLFVCFMEIIAFLLFNESFFKLITLQWFTVCWFYHSWHNI